MGNVLRRVKREGELSGRDKCTRVICLGENMRMGQCRDADRALTGGACRLVIACFGAIKILTRRKRTDDLRA